jgi:uncharacterized protein YgbK (DUF1537 family)
MLELAVLADDITGAADTGAQFLAVASPVYLLDHRLLCLGGFERPPRAIAVFTSSRGLSAAEAGRVVAAAGRAIRGFHPQRVYKKIDSALRGHIGVELEAAMEAMGLPLSFIVPAFPEQGRTTLGGVHHVHGVPVAASEMGRDPIGPVTDSVLPRWIGMQTVWPVAHLPVETIEAGLEEAAQAIERERSRGARHISFDATANGHLDRIARLALERFPDALLCGSAGLAQRLAGRLKRAASETVPRPAALEENSGHFLFVCGSASETLRRQATVLAEHAGVAVETLSPAVLIGDDAAALRESELSRAAAAFSQRDVVLQISPPSGPSGAVDPRSLVLKLAEFAADMMGRAKTAGLFLSGGDTALAVLERLQVKAVRLEREMASGLVYGTLVGGPLTGGPIVTKAGSFGPPHALLSLYRSLRPG